jgi:hypothetical protein
MRLNDDDAHTLDWLMERATDGSSDSPSLTLPATSSLTPARVEGVERVLAVLSTLPETEPPTDLADRTVRFVQDAIRSGMAAGLDRPVVGINPT